MDDDDDIVHITHDTIEKRIMVSIRTGEETLSCGMIMQVLQDGR